MTATVIAAPPVTTEATWNITGTVDKHPRPRNMIYTDGSVREHGGGWAWYHPESGTWSAGATPPKVSSVGSEVVAAIRAISQWRHEPCLQIMTDSQQLSHAWARYRNGDKLTRTWRTYTEEIAHAAGTLEVDIRWVRGHAASAANRFVDRLAYHAGRHSSGTITAADFDRIVAGITARS